MRNFILALLVIFLAFPSFAAVTQNKAVTCQTAKESFVQFTHASTAGTYATAYTGGSNGSHITSVFISNNDASATHLVTCGLFNSATQYWSNSVTTTSPAAGYNNISMTSQVNWPGLAVDSDGNFYINLNSASDTLQCTFATTITSPDTVTVGVFACDF